MNRRLFLGGAAGTALALPLLESLATAGPTAVPLRLVVYVTGEGNLPTRWTPPPLAGDQLQLSEMLAPLSAHQDKLVVVSGVSNLVAPLHTTNGHNAPGHTLMNAALVDTTGSGAFDPNIEVTQGSLGLGPSIDHHLADQLGLPEPINLAVGGADGGENRMWYKVKSGGATGANPEAPMKNDPVDAFTTYLVGNSMPSSSTRADRFRSQRKSVLDGALASFDHVSTNVSQADRLRLEAHADAIRAIEKKLDYVPPVDCGGLVQNVPAGFSVPGWPDYAGQDIQANLMVDVMVNALACGANRIVTLQDTNYDGPPFEFLPVGPVEGWHAQVHNDPALGLGYASADDNPTLRAGFLYYATVFAQLLDKMDAIVEPNGLTLLDNSVVLWISEFGTGQSHSTNDLPVVLAGGAQGKIKTNRHLARPTATTGDLYTSLLDAFGVAATSFGYNDASGFNHGGIAGLVG